MKQLIYIMIKKQSLKYAFALLLFWTSCSNEEHTGQKECHKGPFGTVATKQGNSTCPYLTKDAKGRLVLSWISEFEDPNENQILFAFWDEVKKQFVDTTEIGPSKGVKANAENIPKVAFEPNGRAVAVWGIGNSNPANQYAGLVRYSVSDDFGKSWSGPFPLVVDPESYDQRYFDLSLNKDGKTAVIWLDNRKAFGGDGSTLYFATMGADGRFREGKEVCSSLCQCCRTDLYTDQKGNLHAAFRKIFNDSIRDMAYIVSTDNGESFSAPERISADNWVLDGCPHTGPTITGNALGLHFAWYTQGTGKGVFYSKKAHGNSLFSDKEPVSEKILAKHPQATSMPDGKLLIVWDEADHTVVDGHSNIGVQLRDSSGKSIRKYYMKDDNWSFLYPVASPVSENEFVVAFVSTDYSISEVKFRILSLD